MKIKIEINVPDGDFCHECERHVPWKESCTLGCSLFNKRTSASFKLPECKAAKIIEKVIHCCDIPGCLSCGNPE